MVDAAELKTLTEQRDNVRTLGERIAAIKDPSQQETVSRYLLGVMDGFSLGLAHSESVAAAAEGDMK